MNNKRIIYLIVSLVSLLILSIVFFAKNNMNSRHDKETANTSLLKAAQNDIEEESYSTENTSSIQDIDHDNTKTNKSELEDKLEEEKLIQEDLPDDTNNTDGDIDTSDIVDEAEVIPEDIYDTITISAAGDVTLGRDENFGWERTFDHELELQNWDFGYFFKNVKDIFEADDLTIVNLETTLTTATNKADKKFRFKADPSYVEILKQGNIEAVSIANNHTLDFLEKGYMDTLETLDDAGVGYFGYEHKYIRQVRDVKIGVLGYYCMKITDKQKDEIKQAIEELRNEGTDLVIVMFHWGIERDYWPNSTQKELAYYSIDQGADLVLGSHPHVLQGIEEYKGKQIVYSLGNFCFGGNKNPSDKDTMIYIQRFNFKNRELISQEYDIIPCSISSVGNRNNYQPTPLEGKEAERVINKINKYSDF